MPAEKKKPIGIKEIAELAKVSIGTVDRVIHNRSGVAPNTRARVLRLLDEHSYKTNILASRLKLASRKKIKLMALVPELSHKSNYWELHMRGMNRALEELEELGVVMEVHKFKFLHPKSFRRRLRSIFKKDFDGMVTVPFYHEEMHELVEWAAERCIPLAFLDSETSHSFAGFTTYQDSHEAGQVAGRLVDTVAPNAESVFIFQTSRDGRINSNSRERASSFMQFLDGKGGTARSYTLLQHRLEDEDSLQETLVAQLKDINEFVVFVTNSRSYLVAEILQKIGRGDGKVIGFDLNEPNIRHLKAGSIQFLINQKPEFQSYTAVKELYQLLANKATPSIASTIRIPVEIVVAENVDFYEAKNRFAT